jgi:hypothetical protein
MMDRMTTCFDAVIASAHKHMRADPDTSFTEARFAGLKRGIQLHHARQFVPVYLGASSGMKDELRPILSTACAMITRRLYRAMPRFVEANA